MNTNTNTNTNANTNTTEQEEKRQAPRIEVQMTADLKTTYIYTTASVLNVSKSGMFIKTRNPLPEGSEVEISLYLARQDQPRHFKGVVRWGRTSPQGSVPPGMGVKLFSDDADLLATIADEIMGLPKNL